MRIVNTKRSILDSIIEITAQKSKILLTDNDILHLYHQHPQLEYVNGLVESVPDEVTTIRAEDLEEETIYLRKAIGNLETIKTPIEVMANGMKEFLDNGHDFHTVNAAFSELTQKVKVINIENVLAISEKYNLPSEVLLKHIDTFERFRELSIIDTMHTPIIVEWDGIKSLSDLFQAEIVPSESSKYLDQEFINYLKENNQDLDRIHWRNFERLVAEFFKKVGYHVELGPGTNDGGIDIRVWTDLKSSEGPPLMLIQCKRYSEGNKVSIDTVKAFYADVIHEDAEVGLIATTSSIASGGKKVVNVRGYNISTAESEEIKKMVYEMWRESFKY